MAAYEINLKGKLTLKIGQRKWYNYVGRIYVTLFEFLSTLKCIFTLCLLLIHELQTAVSNLVFMIFDRLYRLFYL